MIFTIHSLVGNEVNMRFKRPRLINRRGRVPCRQLVRFHLPSSERHLNSYFCLNDSGYHLPPRMPRSVSRLPYANRRWCTPSTTHHGREKALRADREVDLDSLRTTTADPREQRNGSKSYEQCTSAASSDKHCYYCKPIWIRLALEKLVVRSKMITVEMYVPSTLEHRDTQLYIRYLYYGDRCSRTGIDHQNSLCFDLSHFSLMPLRNCFAPITSGYII